jgi:hypothetical protein
MSKRIPIGTKVAVRRLMSNKWDPAFVIGYSVVRGLPFAYHIQYACHIYENFVCDSDIVVAQFWSFEETRHSR